jgi:hypothetical protein
MSSGVSTMRHSNGGGSVDSNFLLSVKQLGCFFWCFINYNDITKSGSFEFLICQSLYKLGETGFTHSHTFLPKQPLI